VERPPKTRSTEAASPSCGTGKLEEEVFGEVADLLDLEVNLLFFGTTSTFRMGRAVAGR
jgi:hypothetical protein